MGEPRFADPRLTRQQNHSAFANLRQHPAIEEQSEGRLDPTTGALYQVLRRLSDEEWISAVPTPKDTDPRRRYFVLTSQGRRAAAAEAARLDALVRMARKRRLFPHRV